ncbi:copper chaperone PCu(A)C [Paracoccus seriniphilus]|uniref:copper chaperone PCu(A)C n=1 Tax=Paracoccus seriniphilus TaxID=184748 RepID=UPI0035655C1E
MKPLLCAILLGTALLSSPVRAEMPMPDTTEVQIEDLTISGAFMRATLPRAPVGGGYLTIANHGSTDDRLLSVQAPIGSDVQIHEMAHKDGVMTMRPLPEGLPIPAGETVVLEPSGIHLMIMGLQDRLQEGESYELTLHFEHAGDVTLPFDVLALNARSHSGKMASHMHEHMTAKVQE